MRIRKATYEDLPALMEIYRQGREIQLESGNLHQWREGYPGEEVVRGDIGRGVSHVIVAEPPLGDEAQAGEAQEKIIGAFALIPGIDPTYLKIEGAWIDTALPYATIHRLAKLKSASGIAAACFDWSWRQLPVLFDGAPAGLRIDTHVDNATMRHCIEAFGFQYCGVIHLLNGDPRLAYQKIV